MFENEKMAAMHFEQVQRFILVEKVFWGYGHFEEHLYNYQNVDQFIT